MSELPISSKYRSTPDAPVTEDERNQLTQRLNEAFEAGQLDQDDYSGRLDRLYAAQRLGELVPVVDGLPVSQSYAEPALVQQAGSGRPGELAEPRSANRAALAVVLAIVALVVLLVLILGIAL